MTFVGVASGGVQFQRFLESRMLKELWPFTTEIHGFPLHVLIVDVH